MPIFLQLLLFNSLLVSCKKEQNTFSVAKLKNTTHHQIELVPFRFGSIDSSKYFSLNYNEEKVIEDNISWGKLSAPGIFGKYFSNLDSITVIFDGLYSVTHLIENFESNTVKLFRTNDKNNIAMLSGYESRKLEESKHSISWLLIKEFTEADYEYAKQ